MQKHVILLFLFIISPLAIAATPMQQLLTRLTSLNSMQANFSQITQADGKAVQRATGKMAVLRPGKFYWRIHGLSDQLIIADGANIWVYDKDLAQVTVQDMQTLQGDVPGLLLAGSPLYIQRHYTVQLVKSPEKTQTVFKLIPQAAQSLFQYALLAFEGKKLQSMQFVDNLEQTTTLKFTNITLNPTLPNALFKFTPPKGVDVIRQQN